MKTRAHLAVAALGLTAAALPVLSQDLGLRPRGSETRTTGGDPNRGRFLAFGGMHGELRISCAQCHGMDGVGNSSGAFPRLTDQAGWYLYKSLEDYAAGLRPSDIMGPIARLLTPQQMQDISAYYASIRDAPYPPPPEADVHVRQIGGAIAAMGAPEQGVPACNGCHGANGVGQPPIYPYLAGQYAPYTEHQLTLWKEGRRDGDPMNVMELIAKAMTAEQIRAVSLYYASVRPPKVTPQDVLFAPPGGRPGASAGGGAVGQGTLPPIRGNPTGVGAVRSAQPQPPVVPGAQPGAPPAPTVDLPIGLPRQRQVPAARPPYLPDRGDTERGGMTTTGSPANRN